jgi:hypothetical protein
MYFISKKLKIKFFFQNIEKKLSPYKFYSFNPYFRYLLKVNLSFGLYFLYLFSANFFNFFLQIKKNRLTFFFQKNGFYKRILKNGEFPFELLEYLNIDIEKNDRIPINCHLNNYEYQKNMALVDSQKHVYDIPNALMEGLDQYIRKDKDFDNLIKFYFKSNYFICNIRMWRYLANDKKKLKSEVRAHYDIFPHKTLKIMIYKGFFLKNHAALDIIDQKTNKLIYSIKGKNPILLFDSNHLYHGAKFPLQNRDTIEITLIPSITIKHPLHGGFAAGYPVNPFKECKKKN